MTGLSLHAMTNMQTTTVYETLKQVMWKLPESDRIRILRFATSLVKERIEQQKQQQTSRLS
jgi:hypothetical protein